MIIDDQEYDALIKAVTDYRMTIERLERHVENMKQPERTPRGLVVDEREFGLLVKMILGARL